MVEQKVKMQTKNRINNAERESWHYYVFDPLEIFNDRTLKMSIKFDYLYLITCLKIFLKIKY